MQHAQCVLLFLVLVVNPAWLQILCSYMFLLKSHVFMHSCLSYKSKLDSLKLASYYCSMLVFFFRLSTVVITYSKYTTVDDVSKGLGWHQGSKVICRLATDSSLLSSQFEPKSLHGLTLLFSRRNLIYTKWVWEFVHTLELSFLGKKNKAKYIYTLNCTEQAGLPNSNKEYKLRRLSEDSLWLSVTCAHQFQTLSITCLVYFKHIPQSYWFYSLLPGWSLDKFESKSLHRLMFTIRYMQKWLWE